MPLPIQVGPANLTINRDDRVLVCQPDGRISESAEEGFFARDTRFVSGWELRVNGRLPVLLNSSAVESYSARFELTNDALNDEQGAIDRHSLSIRVDRSLLGGVHEDLDIVNYGRRSVRLVIELEIASDFADLFDVKSGQLTRRGTLDSRWFRSRQELRNSYANRDFRRDLLLIVERARPAAQYANGRLIFVAAVEPRGTWHTCLRWLPIVDRSGRRPPTLSCNAISRAPGSAPVQRLPPVHLAAPDHGVVSAWEQAIRDLEALRLEDQSSGRGVIVPAAGVPWFVTLFGRDSLIVSMQVISSFPEFAAGALRRLSQLQATSDDPERDMEPGKIAHEIRHGELAELGILPYQPYYGTHDATSLFITVLSTLYDWSGDIDVLRRYLPNAIAGMRWLDESGDRDADGLQEYETRSQHGYYNQGWKDAGDAVQHADGALAPLPIALIELQGYAYDAKVRLAVMQARLGRAEEAARLREEARRLFELINDRFWWEAEGTYYLGLDGAKKPIQSVASNPGHLLGCGVVPRDRAARMVSRLMAPDMWSGWGIRTLSSDHVAYNPFSYHLGTVWPHDNVMIAAGMQQYGFHDEVARMARGLFDAASRFQAQRLPELFAGLAREPASFPVQYLGANVPQAWAAGAVVRLVASLAGIEARSDNGGSRLYVDPVLPAWLPSLRLSGLRAGRGSLSLDIRPDGVDVTDNTSGFRLIRGRAPYPSPDDPRSG